MKYFKITIVYWFYKSFIILDINVALISDSFFKGDIKGCQEQRADRSDQPQSAPCWHGSTPARVGYGQTRWRLPLQTAVTGSSWADGYPRYSKQVLDAFINIFESTVYKQPLAQVRVCRLFGTKPLPGPMLAYCQLDPWEQISVKFGSESYHYHSRECMWKCRCKMAAIISWPQCVNEVLLKSCW